MPFEIIAAKVKVNGLVMLVVGSLSLTIVVHGAAFFTVALLRFRRTMVLS